MREMEIQESEINILGMATHETNSWTVPRPRPPHQILFLFLPHDGYRSFLECPATESHIQKT